MTDLTAPELVLTDLVATDRIDATRQLAQTLADAGRVTDLQQFLTDVAAREEQMATGIPAASACPTPGPRRHVPSLAVGRVVSGERIDWGAPDGPANLVFLIAAPTEGEADHLQILAAWRASSCTSPSASPSSRRPTRRPCPRSS